MRREILPKQTVPTERKAIFRHDILRESRISMHQIDHLPRLDARFDPLHQRVDKLDQHRLQLADVRRRQELGKCFATQLMQLMSYCPERHLYVPEHASRPPELVDLFSNSGVQFGHEVQVGVVDVELVWVDADNGAYRYKPRGYSL